MNYIIQKYEIGFGFLKFEELLYCILILVCQVNMIEIVSNWQLSLLPTQHFFNILFKWYLKKNIG